MIQFNLDSAQANAEKPFSVTVIGIGGSGTNVIDKMALEGASSVDLVSLNCDARALNTSMAGTKLQLGKSLTQGLGCGGDPELGAEAAMASADEIRGLLAGRNMVFICVGLGGGTGSGAAPVVARMAREAGAFVIVFVTLPFAFEGRRRGNQASIALQDLRKYANALITFENDRMGELVVPKKGVQEAFELADKIIGQSVRAVTSLVTQPGLIQIGMDELVTALHNTDSRCLFGYGLAKGENRAVEALSLALKSPLLDRGQMLSGARNVLVHVCGGTNLTLFEIETLMRDLGKHVHEDAQILFGAATDPKLQENLSVTILTSLNKPVPVVVPVAEEIVEVPAAPPAAPAPVESAPAATAPPAASVLAQTPAEPVAAAVIPPAAAAMPEPAAVSVAAPPPVADVAPVAQPGVRVAPVILEAELFPVMEASSAPSVAKTIAAAEPSIVVSAPVPAPVPAKAAAPAAPAPVVKAAPMVAPPAPARPVYVAPEPEPIAEAIAEAAPVAEYVQEYVYEEPAAVDEILAYSYGEETVEEVQPEPAWQHAVAGFAPAEVEEPIEEEMEAAFVQEQEPEPEPEPEPIPVPAPRVMPAARPAPERVLRIERKPAAPPVIRAESAPAKRFVLSDIIKREPKRMPEPAMEYEAEEELPSAPVPVPTPPPARQPATVSRRAPDYDRITPIRPIPAGRKVTPVSSPFSPAKAASPTRAVPTQQQTFDERLQPASSGGRFDRVTPTVEEGEDLDVPTFLRRKR